VGEKKSNTDLRLNSVFSQKSFIFKPSFHSFTYITFVFFFVLFISNSSKPQRIRDNQKQLITVIQHSSAMNIRALDKGGQNH